jgi:hypothetical protein
MATDKGELSPWNNSMSSILANDAEKRKSRKEPTHTSHARDTDKSQRYIDGFSYVTADAGQPLRQLHCRCILAYILTLLPPVLRVYIM